MKFYIVDCFAEEKYQGNELLVIKADRHVSDEEQQKIAREINFSETTFILSDKKRFLLCKLSFFLYGNFLFHLSSNSKRPGNGQQ